MFELIIKNDRRFRLLHNEILHESEYSDLELINIIKKYLKEYTAFYNLNEEYIIKSYNNTLEKYSDDIIAYMNTGKYPFQINSGEKFIRSRTEYDLALILSILFTKHRFCIAKEIYYNCNNISKALFIGVGSGVELSLVSDKILNLIAYDDPINEFVIGYFPKCKFYMKYFEKSNDTFDAIYLIEILEHLKNPYYLIQNCYNSINLNGLLFLTTATNIPQFDHYYNFTNDSEFEQKLENLGLKMLLKKDIPHEMKFTPGLNAKNCFYIFQRTSA